jgi:hypothetical protein
VRREKQKLAQRDQSNHARREKLNWRRVIPSPNNMASIYKKVPLYKVVKAWGNNNPNLSEVYKLQSSNLRNKS